MRAGYASSGLVAFFYVAFFCIFSFISAGIAYYAPWFSLSENQIMYLYSTSAQVLAALYGLTLTGYLFFRGELQREARSDESLAASISKLEKRYLIQLIVITGLVAVTILLINLVIAQQQSEVRWVSVILMNAAQTGFAVSFSAIALFVLDVVRPFRVEKASRDIQNEIDPGHSQEDKKGSLEDFIKNYNEIEAILKQNSKEVVPFTVSDERYGKRKRFVSNVRLAELLWRRELIDERLMSKLKDLISLRNAIVHGADPAVSQDIVEKSFEVLEDLKLALGYLQTHPA